MRFVKFLSESAITTAINIDEPKTGRKYAPDAVKKRVEAIEKAKKELEKKGINTEADEATYADLEDKLNKWQNVNKETEAPKAVPAQGDFDQDKEREKQEDEADKEAEKEDEKAAKEAEKEDKQAEKDADKADKEAEKEELDKEKDREADQEEKQRKEREKRKKEALKKKEKQQQEGRLIKSKIRMKLS